MSSNKPVAGSNPQDGRVASKPTGGDAPDLAPGVDKFTTIFKEKGWTMGVYENEQDGTQGFILTNGKTAFHFDQAGNMIMTTGKPLGGCGGKAIVKGEEKLEKFHSVAIEITGNDDQEEDEEGSNGDTETVKKPAYSLTVYGDVAIESVGGDIGMRANNISLNAASTLTLTSGENIIVDSKGNCNINAAQTLIAGGTLRKRLSVGEYSEGGGEVKTEQRKPGAKVSIETPGSLEYVVNGNYELGIKGDFAINTVGNYALSSQKSIFQTAKGNADEKIEGKKKIYVGGKSLIPIEQLETYLTEIGAGAGKTSFKVDADQDLDLNSKIGAINQTAKVAVNIDGTALVKVVGKAILLN